MEMVNLVEFVRTGEIFDKIEGYYEQIVSDFDFGKLDGFVQIKNISDLDKIDKSKKTLFILDKLLIENIFDYLSMKYFTILDMNFGILGYGKKIGFSKFDIVNMINVDVDIYEPLDFISMLYYLEKHGKNYLRINSLDMPSNFVYNNDVVDILSLENRGFSGDNFTIVTTGSMMPEIIRTTHLLNENGIFVDLVILNKLNFEVNEYLLKNKNIIFVIDLLNANNYEKLTKEKINGSNIFFIYPKYDNLKTILDEYLCEESYFDALSLFRRINELKN